MYFRYTRVSGTCVVLQNKIKKKKGHLVGQESHGTLKTSRYLPATDTQVVPAAGGHRQQQQSAGVQELHVGGRSVHSVSAWVLA